MALSDNIISHYKFEENAANTTVVDEKGANTGIASTNTSNLTTASGKFDNGFDFVSANSEDVDLNSDAIVGGRTAFTISMWAKADSLSGTRVLYGGWGDVPVSVYFRVSGGNLQCFLHDGTTQFGGSTQAFSDTASMHHFIARYDGTTLSTWIDGSIGGTTYSISSITVDNGHKETIGQTGEGTNLNFWDGIIDEVTIWSVALSDTLIAELYNSGSGVEYPFTTAAAPNSIAMGANF